MRTSIQFIKPHYQWSVFSLSTNYHQYQYSLSPIPFFIQFHYYQYQLPVLCQYLMRTSIHSGPLPMSSIKSHYQLSPIPAPLVLPVPISSIIPVHVEIQYSVPVPISSTTAVHWWYQLSASKYEYQNKYWDHDLTCILDEGHDLYLRWGQELL